MRACITAVLRPALLAILIGAMPPALALASDAPAAGPHQEVKADAHGAAPAVGEADVAGAHGAQAE